MHGNVVASESPRIQQSGRKQHFLPRRAEARVITSAKQVTKESLHYINQLCSHLLSQHLTQLLFATLLTVLWHDSVIHRYLNVSFEVSLNLRAYSQPQPHQQTYNIIVLVVNIFACRSQMPPKPYKAIAVGRKHWG